MASTKTKYTYANVLALPGLTYIDHTEVELDFEQRFTMYFNRINRCMPRIIMVEKCKMIKHKEIVVVDETRQLKTVGIYRNCNHCDFVWSHDTKRKLHQRKLRRRLNAKG